MGAFRAAVTKSTPCGLYCAFHTCFPTDSPRAAERFEATTAETHVPSRSVQVELHTCSPLPLELWAVSNVK